MNISPETILAVSAFLTSLGTLITLVVSSAKTAKKDAMTLIQEEVARLQRRIVTLEDEKEKWNEKYEKEREEWNSKYELADTNWRKKYDDLYAEITRLRNENAMLKRILTKNGIDLSSMKVVENDGIWVSE